jgi:hypothetical protein
LLSIRRSLTRIVVAALLPMGLFAGLLFYFLWDNQQTQRNQEQLARVKTMGAGRERARECHRPFAGDRERSFD